jgi:F-type H+-transporting ATPase subunit delta
MQNPRLATRYAKSLFGLAVEKNSLEDTLADMHMLSSICHKSRDFENMLRSPVIKADKKLHIVDAILKNSIHTLSHAFVNLLINKGREAYLPEISQAFITQYKTTKKIKTLKLSTAVAVDAELKNAIRDRVAADMKEHAIELETAVNPELIGGFVLEMEDKLFDASVRRDLHDIRRELIDTSYVSNLR